jgi:hypothetical protein
VSAISEALATLARGHGDVGGELDRLPDRHLTTTGIGGGRWSPKDLLGHLALWHEIALRTIGEFDRREPPWIVGVFASPGPGPNDDELAARSGWTLDRARGAYDQSYQSVVSTFEGLGDDRWGMPVDGWAEDPATLGGLLGVVLGSDGLPFGHAYAHLPELSAFVDEHLDA